MSLKDIYVEAYGSLDQGIESSETIEKLADALQASPEEIAQALFEEGMIDEDGNWLGEEGEGDVEKVAQDFDAAGRIMARGLLSELEEIEKEAAGLPVGPAVGAGKAIRGALGIKTPALQKLLAKLRAAKVKAGELSRKKGVRPTAAGLGIAGVGAGGYTLGKRR